MTHNKCFSFIVSIFALIFSSLINANAMPPLEVYGNLPSLRSMEITPDGNRIGYISRTDEGEAFFLFDLVERQLMTGVRTDKVKTNYVTFAGPDFAILHASKTTRLIGYRGKFDYSAAFAFDLKTEKLKQLLKGTEELYPAQSGIGRIVGLHQDGNQVFMPAFSGSTTPVYSLFRVNLKSGKGRLHKRGNKHTDDWFVARDGTVLARVDYNDDRNIYTIHAGRDGKLKEIYKKTDAKIPPFTVVGVKPDHSALIIFASSSKSNSGIIVELSMDGKFSEPIFFREDSDASPLITQNREVIGVQFSGLRPSYEFFDKSLMASMNELQALFGSASIRLTSWSDDMSKILVDASGGTVSPSNYFFDRNSNKIIKLPSTYSGLNDSDMAEVLTIKYKARDGKRIPSILTRPPGWNPEQKYPTIIMPHGGPESYDAVGFDWMAQFFASRGYLVLQPNFRGSDGFGNDYLLEGRGQWGRGVMQHDVTDGLMALIRAGWSDPERACIIGWSYGGYSALAGGAFTPDLYSCVGAIAPVSHLPRMLIDEKRDHGKNSWVVTYWSRLIGDPKSEQEKLRHISPALHADKFQAPVLLIHGQDDLVVPITQSVIMDRALKKAGKDVEFVRIKGEDHNLSGSENRVTSLRALEAFVLKSIGPGISPNDQ